MDTGSGYTRGEADPRGVFVVHGRNDEAKKAVFEFLGSIGLRPLEWDEIVKATGKPNPYIWEVVRTGFLMAQAVVVLMTPDDEARLRREYRRQDEAPEETELTPQPRQNVLVEAGVALALFEDRTVIVQFGRLRQASDFFGRHIIRMDNSAEMWRALAQQLETAGCVVDLRGKTWQEAGSFPVPVQDVRRKWLAEQEEFANDLREFFRGVKLWTAGADPELMSTLVTCLSELCKRGQRCMSGEPAGRLLSGLQSLHQLLSESKQSGPAPPTPSRADPSRIAEVNRLVTGLRGLSEGVRTRARLTEIAFSIEAIPPEDRVD